MAENQRLNGSLEKVLVFTLLTHPPSHSCPAVCHTAQHYASLRIQCTGGEICSIGHAPDIKLMVEIYVVQVLADNADLDCRLIDAALEASGALGFDEEGSFPAAQQPLKGPKLASMPLGRWTQAEAQKRRSEAEAEVRVALIPKPYGGMVPLAMVRLCFVGVSLS